MCKCGLELKQQKRPGVIFQFFTRLSQLKNADLEAGGDVKDGFSDGRGEVTALDQVPVRHILPIHRDGGPGMADIQRWSTGRLEGINGQETARN